MIPAQNAIKAFKIVTWWFSKECYVPSVKELFLTAISQPREAYQIYLSVFVFNSFFMLPSSKGYSVRAYVDTI